MNKKDFYELKVNDYKLYDKEALIRYERAIELAQFSDNCNLLDIGCKNAILNELLKSKQKIDYYGTDISENVFTKIKNFNSSKFKIADVSKEIPFPSNYFDFVFALEIMEHVEAPTKMLQEIYRILKDDGTLILSVPNIYCWNEIVNNLKKLPDTEGHISAFTYQIMERLLKFNNLEILNYCGTFMRYPFSSKLRKGKYLIRKSNNIFLTRSFIYKIKKSIKK